MPCDAGFELQQLPWWLPQPRLKGCGWGSHGADNKFVFGTTHGDDSLHAAPYPRLECPFDADEWALADYIGGRWAAFAKGDAPWWPFLVTSYERNAPTYELIVVHTGVMPPGTNASAPHVRYVHVPLPALQARVQAVLTANPKETP